MALIDYPAELSKSFWDKKKGAVPPASPLETQLKLLEKKHVAIAWDDFEPGWDKAAKTAAALDDAYGALDRVFRNKVFPLKLEAQAAADAAQKLMKDKASAKPTLEAGKAVVDAVKGYAKAIDTGMAQLEQAHAKAAAVLKVSAAKTSDDDDEDAPGALLQPKRLLAQLQMSKRSPERRVQFAFVSDGKSDAGLSLSPKMSAKSLFAKVQAESGVKTGGFGTAWIADNTLFLQMDKAFGGMVKKMRAPLKAVGFKVSKIVLASEDGTVLEEDQEADDATTTDSGDNGSAATASATATTSAPDAKPGVAPGVAFTQTRLVWDQTRKKVRTELQKLEASILDTCKDEPDLAEIASGAKNLYEVLDYLDERLIDKLDEALNAAEPQARQARQDEARQIVDEYVDFINSDELMQDIDDNGFTGVAIKSTLTASLTAIGQRLRA